MTNIPHPHLRRFDLAPLLRQAIGFDPLSQVADALASQVSPAFPPYDILKISETEYRITLALAGYAPEKIDIEIKDEQLVISSKAAENEKIVDGEAGEGAVYLHRGIANRSFTRIFGLADAVEVKGATFDNGLLHIDLERKLPEKPKGQKIEIKTARA